MTLLVQWMSQMKCIIWILAEMSVQAFEDEIKNVCGTFKIIFFPVI